MLELIKMRRDKNAYHFKYDRIEMPIKFKCAHLFRVCSDRFKVKQNLALLPFKTTNEWSYLVTVRKYQRVGHWKIKKYSSTGIKKKLGMGIETNPIIQNSKTKSHLGFLINKNCNCRCNYRVIVTESLGDY